MLPRAPSQITFNVSQTKRLRGVTKRILQNHGRNTVLEPGLPVMAELIQIYTSKAEMRPYPWHLSVSKLFTKWTRIIWTNISWGTRTTWKIECINLCSFTSWERDKRKESKPERKEMCFLFSSKLGGKKLTRLPASSFLPSCP